MFVKIAFSTNPTMKQDTEREGQSPARADIRKWCLPLPKQGGNAHSENQVVSGADTERAATAPPDAKEPTEMSILDRKECTKTNATNVRNGRERGKKLGESTGLPGSTDTAAYRTSRLESQHTPGAPRGPPTGDSQANP